MKTIIILIFLTGVTTFSQTTNYTIVPPFNKFFTEVIKTEKIDTSKAIISSDGLMFIDSRIDSDSVQIMYKFNLENRLTLKGYAFHLNGHTGKAALKKYRAHNTKIAAKFGRAELFEVIEGQPSNDQDKLWYLSKRKPLMSSYETDTFYILSTLILDVESGIYKIQTTFVSPEEWNKLRND
ncbi:hypothetical protein MASR1M107_06090 [Ignavibacteriales bacterium]